MFCYFFLYVDIKFENIYIFNGNVSNLEEECISYEVKIKEVGGIEFFFGGVGLDGYIVFNELGFSMVLWI